jgi:outer membrane lipoprotein-sorting protein
MTGLDFLLMPYLGALVIAPPAAEIAEQPVAAETAVALVLEEEVLEATPVSVTPAAEPAQEPVVEEVRLASLQDEVAEPVLEIAYEETAPLATDAEAPAVFADLSDEEILAKATAYLESIKTLEARFFQTAPSGNVTTGVLQMSRPSRLRVDYDDPNPNLIIATQGKVYLHDADLETTDSYPIKRTPLKFLLSKELKTDDAILQQVYRGSDEVALTLSSKEEDTEGALTLVFAAPEMQLRRWAMDDGRGITVVDLTEVQQGVKIANGAFRIPDAGGSFLRDR